MDGWQRRKTSLSSSSPHYTSFRPIWNIFIETLMLYANVPTRFTDTLSSDDTRQLRVSSSDLDVFASFQIM